jgi:hypothetical protein
MPRIFTFGQFMVVKHRSGYILLNERMCVTATLRSIYGCSDLFIFGELHPLLRKAFFCFAPIFSSATVDVNSRA